MKCWRVVLIVFLASVGSGCKTYGDRLAMYIVVPGLREPAFTVSLAKILKDEGIDADVNTGGGDNHLHMLHARKSGVSVDAINPGGDTAGACVAKQFSFPNPVEYHVSIQRVTWLLPGEATVATIAARLKQDLLAHGYEVRQDQVRCASR